MKLTKKTVSHETTETVCEITQEEFDMLCAKTAAALVVDFIGDNPEASDFTAGLSLTHLFAKFVSKLDSELFNDKTENPDKKEEK